MQKMRNSHGRTWNMARNIEKRAKRETHTVGPGLCQRTVKYVQNEKCTIQDLEYGNKTEKRGKRDANTL